MRFLLPSLALIAGCGGKQAPVQTPASDLPSIPDDLETKLPIDPSVKSGVLPNGLTWYVETNKKPEARAELRLAVKVGSIVEDEDQLGLAHFAEHMAFNGSEHFESNQLVEYLESIGTSFGSHLNAYTSFDETVYQLQVPTDDTDLLDKGFLVLEDWAGGLTFDPVECERERGVVLEEWRTGQGLPQRIQDTTLPVTFHGSRYAERLPIGTPESLESFECDAAVRFYNDWYRPDQMAVIAVGDFDPAWVEQKIVEHFGGLTNPAEPRERVRFDVPDHDETLYAVFSDHEMPQTSVSMLAKVDDVEGDTHGAYRDFLMTSMIFGMINERLGVAAMQPGAAFMGAGAGMSGLGWERGAHSLGVMAKEGQALAAFEAVLMEAERVKKFGFTAPELERAKQEQLAGMQTYYDEREKTPSSSHVGEIVRVFLTGEAMPGVAYEYAMSQKLVPAITLDDVNDWARAEWMPEASRVVQLLMPAKEGLEVPDAEALAAAIARAEAAELQPPEAEGDDVPLMATLPEPGTVTETGRNAVLDTVEWSLSNGIRVILKVTDFQADAVSFTAWSPGGTSVVDDAELVPALTAISILNKSGVGQHDAVALSRKLAGKTVSVSPWLGSLREGIDGSASVEDLETMFQLIHLSLTEPRFDQTGFDLELDGREEGLRNRLSTPQAIFWDTYTELMWQGHPRYMPWRMEDLEAMDLDASRRIYEQRFGSLGDTTFVFVGNIDLATFEPLVARYLASLPAGEPGESWRDTGARRVDGTHTKSVSSGDTPRAQVRLEFHGPFKPDWSSRNQLTALADVIQTRLREELREERGGTYGVGVGGNTTAEPFEGYNLSISFQCDPERADELIEATWAVIDEIKAAPVDASYVDNIKEQYRRSRETSVKNNGFWLGGIAGSMRRGEDPEELLTYPARVDALSPAVVHELARTVLNRERYVLLVQRPEALVEK